ncbi:TPA: replication terminus site-binding protein [Pseudomonas aeruginosa]|nr:replication terminus site-binding protein [Pseudomonas aeruginosa]
MHDRIQVAFQALREAIEAFNVIWPERVISGAVWRLPLLTEQKTPDDLPVELLEGEEGIRATQRALLAFELDQSDLATKQAPGTVMRLPGYWLLQTSVLQEVAAINALKEALDMAIEETRIELGLVKTARPKLVRRALKGAYSTKQLLRKIQAFELPPCKLAFTWAGDTAGTTRLQVGLLRKKLEEEMQHRMDRDGVAPGHTPEWVELQGMANLQDDEYLVQYKKVAPHPRAMLWFSMKPLYDAMIHANLPVFLVEGELKERHVLPLRAYKRSERRGQRSDQVERVGVVARLDIFAPAKGNRKSKVLSSDDEVAAEALEKSTYSSENDAGAGEQ